mmetsp:Transcript_7562/g.24861  ORF Transcript_7562/g.24861 Transcript_7562/m.24861 type:complete len:232 (-) Transcript_7562:1032-1727(-)
MVSACVARSWSMEEEAKRVEASSPEVPGPSTCAPIRSNRSISASETPAPPAPPGRRPPPRPPKSPWPMTACSSPRFWLARAYSAASYVPRETRRYTVTGLCWPMRWQRAAACRSACGFQSGSKRMTVSADVSVMPRPPARVPSRNTGVVQPGASNRAMAACRAAPVMSPSRRSYSSPRWSSTSSSRLSTSLNCEKTSTRCPCSCRCGSSLASKTVLPEADTSASSSALLEA